MARLVTAEINIQIDDEVIADILGQLPQGKQLELKQLLELMESGDPQAAYQLLGALSEVADQFGTTQYVELANLFREYQVQLVDLGLDQADDVEAAARTEESSDSAGTEGSEQSVGQDSQEAQASSSSVEQQITTPVPVPAPVVPPVTQEVSEPEAGVEDLALQLSDGSLNQGDAGMPALSQNLGDSFEFESALPIEFAAQTVNVDGEIETETSDGFFEQAGVSTDIDLTQVGTGKVSVPTTTVGTSETFEPEEPAPVEDVTPTPEPPVVIDPTARLTLVQYSVSGAEGQTLSFSVARQGELNSEPLSVNYALVSLSGDSGVVGLPHDGTLEFAAEQTTANFTLAATSNSLLNAPATFALYFDDAVAGLSDYEVQNDAAAITVLDNDVLVDITSISSDGVRDASGNVTYQVVVSRTGDLTQSSTVSWAVDGVSENPTLVTDFTAASGVLTFGAGVDELVFSVVARPGAENEGVRYFEVALYSSADNIHFGIQSIQANLVPQDVVVSVAASDAQQLEGTSGAAQEHSFEVRLSDVVDEDVVVNWSLNFAGDAVSSDFTGAQSGQVTILAGESVARFVVTPAVDAAVENNETYLVDVEVVSGPAVVIVPQAVGTILNDDTSIGFSHANYEGNEGNAENGTLSVTVVRDGFNKTAISANWKVELVDGGAEAGDFANGQDLLGNNAGLPSGQIELLAGEVQGTLLIETLANLQLEADKAYRIVLFDDGTGAQLATAEASALILNDDAVFSMVDTSVSAVEGHTGEARYIEITVQREGDARVAATVNWQAQGAGDNPASSGDLAVGLNGQFKFEAGESEKTFQIALREDDQFEADETLDITLTGTSTAGHALASDEASLTTRVTILNDDDVVQFYTNSGLISVTEDAADHGVRTLDYTLVRQGDLTTETTVNWSIPLTGDITAEDFEATSGSVTFAAGSSTAVLSLAISNDFTVEQDETFTVRLSAASGSGATIGASGDFDTTLVNDDVAVSAVVAGDGVEGGDGAVATYTFTLSRSGDTDNQSSTINWSLEGFQLLNNGMLLANPLDAEEFTSVTSGTLSWAAGDAADKVVIVTVAGDADLEGAEAFRLVLENGTGDHTSLLGNGTTAIVHDDEIGLAVNALQTSVVEGAAGETTAVNFEIVRTGNLTRKVSVELAATGSSTAIETVLATFDPLSETVTLTYTDGRPDQEILLSGPEQTVNVQLILSGDDLLESGEQITATLQNALIYDYDADTQTYTVNSGDYSGSVVYVQQTASVEISDDDEKITVTAGGDAAYNADTDRVEVVEGADAVDANDPAHTVVFTLTRDASGPLAAATYAYRILGGDSPVNEDDFAFGQEDLSVANDGMPSGTVTFGDGELTKEVSVTLYGDRDIEASEQMYLDLTSATGNLEVDSEIVTVVADDIGFNVIAHAPEVVEGDESEAQRYLSFDLAGIGATSDTAVYWKVTGIDASDLADGESLTGSVVFNRLVESDVVSLAIRQDSVVDAGKTATIQLYSDAGFTTPLLSGSGGTITATTDIIDDDASLNIRYLVNPSTPEEGSVSGSTLKTFEYEIVRADDTDQITTVDWRVVTGDGYVDADDFSSSQALTGTLTFAAGETLKTVTLQFKQDSLYEGDEILEVELVNASEGSEIQTASVADTILNDDAQVQFVDGSLTVTHTETDSGTTPLTFTLERIGNLDQISTVNWSLSNILGINQADFGLAWYQPLPSGTVTFAAGESSAVVTVNVTNDTFARIGTSSTRGSSLEGDEQFKVTLSSASVGTSIGANNQAIGEILNNDVRVQVTEINTNYAEGIAPDDNGDVNPAEAGVQETIPHSLSLIRQGYLGKEASFYWSVPAGLETQISTIVVTDPEGAETTFTVDGSGGTANWTNPSDKLISWAADDAREWTMTFNVIGDNVIEQDFRFSVSATPVSIESATTSAIDEFSVGTSGSAVNVTPETNTSHPFATFTIKRDEAGVWVSNDISRTYDAASSMYIAADATESWGGATDYNDAGTIYTRLAGYPDLLNANALAEGSVDTAESDDFVAASGTLIFTANDISQVLSVTINDDGTYEATESVGLFLNGVEGGATLAVDQSEILIRNDDNADTVYVLKAFGETAIEGIDEYIQVLIDLGKPLTQSNTFDIDFVTNTAYESTTSGEAADFTQYFDYSVDGGITWLTHAPVFEFTYSDSANSIGDQISAVFDFNSRGSDSFDSWLDFTDLQSGQGYMVGGVVNNSQIRVVVELYGAYIDEDGDGVHDESETTLAFGEDSGNDLVDLANNSIVVHFNTAPDWAAPLDLSGFGLDDRIELDRQAFVLNGADEFQATADSNLNLSGAYSFGLTARNEFSSDTKYGSRAGSYFHQIYYGGYTFSLYASSKGSAFDSSSSTSYFQNGYYGTLGYFDYNISAIDLADRVSIVRGSTSSAEPAGIVSWIPVFADAVIDFDALGVSTAIANSESTAMVSGTFVGLADVSDAEGLNAELAEYLIANGVLDSEDVADLGLAGAVEGYFAQYAGENMDASQVQFLKFDIDVTGAGIAAWQIDGLDASVVVAPQDGSIFDQLKLVQNETLEAGSASVDLDIALSSKALFDTDGSIDAVGLYEPGYLMPSFEVVSDDIDADGMRTVVIEVSRTDSSVDDVIDYSLNVDAISSEDLASGSASKQGELEFAAGETTKQLTFVFDAIGKEAPPLIALGSGPVQVIVDTNAGGVTGAWVDQNNDWILQDSEMTDVNLAFVDGIDRVDLFRNAVTIRFNEVNSDLEDSPLNFQGFGADDRIQFNLNELGRDGWAVGSISEDARSAYFNTWQDGYACSSIELSGSTVRGDAYDITVYAYRESRWSSNVGYLEFQGTLSGTGRSYTIATFGSCTDSNPFIDGRNGFNNAVSFVTNSEIKVIVDHNGAFVDLDADGVISTEEAVASNRAFDAETGEALIELEFNPVTIRVNNLLENANGDQVAMDFAGFGWDDRVELDLTQLQANGWVGIGGHNYDADYDTRAVSNGYASTNFYYEAIKDSTKGVDYLMLHGEDFVADTKAYQWGALASFTSDSEIYSSGIDLMNRVAFVNNPGMRADTDATYVVIEADGGWIDTNRDGKLSDDERVSENQVFNFAAATGAVAPTVIDFENDNVVLHFNDVPDELLDLSGFNGDDRIEVDMVALGQNGWLSADVRDVDQYHSYTANSSCWRADGDDTASRLSSSFIVKATRSTGLNEGLAFYAWLEAFSSQSIEVATFGNGAAVVAGDGSLLDRVSIIKQYDQLGDQTAYRVIVDEYEADGETKVGAFIDLDGDGYLDANEAVEGNFAFNPLNGNDWVDMASHSVTVRFNALPDNPLDFLGFGSDDRIELDLYNIFGDEPLGRITQYVLSYDSIEISGLTLGGGSFYKTFSTYSYGSLLTNDSYNCFAAFGYYGADGNFCLDEDGELYPFISLVDAPKVSIVVDKTGAYIDQDGDGVLDVEEMTEENLAFTADGDDLVDLAHTTAVIRFNDAPKYALNLQGFGGDDRIELNTTSLSLSGWYGVNGDITARDNNAGYSDYFDSTVTLRSQSVDQTFKVSAERFYSTTPRLTIRAYDGSIDDSKTAELAFLGEDSAIIDGNFGLLNRISFVEASYTRVIVNENGGWFDTNLDGRLTESELTDENRAFNEVGSNLAVDFDHEQVIVEFEGLPTQALDLSDFGADDRVHIDASALATRGIDAFAFIHSTTDRDSYTKYTGALATSMYAGLGEDSQGLGIFYLSAERTPSGDNLLGLRHETYSSEGGNSGSAQLATFGDSTAAIDGEFGLMSKIVIVKPTTYIVVESSGAFVDANANGELDLGEGIFAFDEIDGSDLLNLRRGKFVIEFNDVPSQPLDLSGFSSDDRIIIDRTAFANNGWELATRATMQTDGSYSTKAYTVTNDGSTKSYWACHTYSGFQSNSGSFFIEGVETWSSWNLQVLSATKNAEFSGVLGKNVWDNEFAFNYVSFTEVGYVTGFDGEALTLSQGGSLTSDGMAFVDTVEIEAGVDEILVRTPIVDDNIDEITETVTVNVEQISGDDFVVETATDDIALVDDDAPVISVWSDGVTDTDLSQDFIVQVIDVNARQAIGGNVYSTGFENGNTNYYATNTLGYDAGAAQGITVTLRFEGQQAWEVALIIEVFDAEDSDTNWNYDTATQLESSDLLHNSAVAFREIQGVEELDSEGQPTGFFTYDLEVPAGTLQVLARAAVGSLSELSDEEDSLWASFTAEITDVDTLLVARNAVVNEAEGTAEIEVVAVGDIADGESVSVDYTTTEGGWTDRAFIVSREFSTIGELTMNWSVESMTDAELEALEGPLGYDYVADYFGHRAITTVDSEDFIILGDQAATGEGLPSGTVTFADGQKEAFITVRVRTDALGEEREDFRITLDGAPEGVSLFSNPDATLTYEELGDAAGGVGVGYSTISNDDQLFVISGSVFNEARQTAVAWDAESERWVATAGNSTGGWISSGNLGVAIEGDTGLIAPDGYTLHQFIIEREGDIRTAASVDWQIVVSGVDADGGFIETAGTDQADGAHQAETADFLSDGSEFGVSWLVAVDGVTRSVAQTVEFASGESQQVITIAVKDDLLAEDAEQFTVELVNPVALPGNDGAPGVSELRGSADFLIADNDGTKVSLAVSWIDENDAAQAFGAENILAEGTGAEWLTDNAGVTTNTYSDGVTSNNHVVALTFTRDNADPTSSQAFFVISVDTNIDEFISNVDGNVQRYVDASGSFYHTNWVGTVEFAAGETTATVLVEIADDHFIEADRSFTVTLYDHEHMVGIADGLYNADSAEFDVAGIGGSGALPDWNTTIRDPDAYTETVTVIDDDIRLWFGSSFGTYNTSWNPTLERWEGNSAGTGDADQFAIGANGEVSFNLVRAGILTGDVLVDWSIVLDGTATLDDFNQSYWLDADGIQTNVAGNVARIGGQITFDSSDATSATVTQAYSLGTLFAVDRDVEDNESFSLNFAIAEADSTGALFTPSYQYEDPNSGPLHRSSLAGQDQIDVNGIILNDDVTYEISLNSANASGLVAEGTAGDEVNRPAGRFVFDVTRHTDVGDDGNDGFLQSSSVMYRVVGTGDNPATGADFAGGVLPTGTVTFNGYNSLTGVVAEQFLKTVTLQFAADSNVEYGEHFTVELYNPSVGEILDGSGSIDGVIVNDDLGVIIDDAQVVEGDSGTSTVTVTVTRIGAIDGAADTSTTWTTANVDTDATDLTAQSNTIVLGTGSTTTVAQVEGYGEQTTNFTFTVNGDSTVENDEVLRTVLSNFTDNIDEKRDISADVTIVNDDATFTIEAATTEPNEGIEGSGSAGTGTVSFLITRSNLTPQAQTVTWTVEGVGRNAVDATDFIGGVLPSGTITFAADELQKLVQIDLSALVSPDSTAEADELFTLVISDFGTGAENDSFIKDSSVTATILNDDASVYISDFYPEVQYEGSGASTNNYVFRIVRDEGTGAGSVDWKVALNLAADADDFDTATLPAGVTWDSANSWFTGTVNFTDSINAVDVALPITADLVSEVTPETFTISLSNPSAGLDIVQSSSVGVTGTIGDDDFALSVADVTKAEGDGLGYIEFTVTRTGDDALSADVNWTLDLSGAADAADFRDINDADNADGVISGSFTFPSGLSSYTLKVPVAGETQYEADEDFTLNLSYDRGNGIVDIDSAVGTLTNDDEGFIVEVSDTYENGALIVTVTRTGNVSGEASVDWALTGVGANPVDADDFTDELSGTLNFDGTEANNQIQFTIAMTNDSVAEYDEGFEVTLSNPSLDTSIATAADNALLLNDDTAYTISVDQSAITEGDLNNQITYTITRIGPANGDVNYRLVTDSGDANALSAADFNEISSLNGTIASSAFVNNVATLTLTLIDDGAQEDLAALQIELIGKTVIAGADPVSVNDDDDNLTLVAQQLANVEELNTDDVASQTLSYEVQRTGSSIGEATVNWTIALNGGNALSLDEIISVNGVAVSSLADLTGTFTFTDGDTTAQTIDVVVATDDVGEYDEQFTVSLSNASTGSNIVNGTFTQTIINDDAAVELFVDQTLITEGNEGDDTSFTFTVRRTGDVSGNSSVVWTLASEGLGLNDLDFGGFLPSGVVSFAAGESEKTVTLVTEGDNLAEDDERFSITLSDAADATIIGDSSALFTLKNDDVGVAIESVTVSDFEGDIGDETSFAFRLLAEGSIDAISGVVKWHLETAGTAPVNSADFVSGQDLLGTNDGLPSGEAELRFVNGSSTKAITVLVAGDPNFGVDEQFKIVIDEVTVLDRNGDELGASITEGSVIATIINDDATIRLTGETSSVTEEAGAELRYYVELSENVTDPGNIYVDFTLSGVNVDANDFASGSLSGSNVALSYDADADAYYVGVEVSEDTDAEAHEYVYLTIDSAGVGSVGNGGVLTDDNSAVAMITNDDYSIQIIGVNLEQDENGARFVFDVLRSGDLYGTMDATWNLAIPSDFNSSSEYGASANDFVEVNGAVRFESGESIARFVIETSAETLSEGDERFSVEVEVSQIDDQLVIANAAQYASIDALILNDDAVLTDDTGYYDASAMLDSVDPVI